MPEYNAKKIKGSNHEWEIVIGLEVHAQIITNLKLSFIVIFVMPLVVFPIIYFGRRVRDLAKKSQDKVASVGTYA